MPYSHLTSRRMWLLMSTMLILAALLAACSGKPPATSDLPGGIDSSNPQEPGQTQAAQPTNAPPSYTAEFDAAECPVDTPENYDIECGYLSMPENRAQPVGQSIRLAVAIVRAENPTDTPIVYLAGGPGSSAFAEFFDDPEGWEPYGWLGERDVIFVDQRGTGYSEPSLNCPEIENVDVEDPISEDPQTDAVIACRDRLIDEGVDLTAYNSVENAADIADLRVALGYDEWNMLGISYGTKLALTVMRYHPEGVRSVILDSVYPPNVEGPIEEATNLYNALHLLMAGCASDPACNEAYPDLEGVLLRTVADLNANPVEYDAIDPDTEDTYTATLYGDDLLNTLTQAMYDSTVMRFLPRLIYEVSEGNYTNYADFNFAMGYARARQDEKDVSDSEGMNYSVECHDEFAFSTAEDAEAALANVPEELQSGLFVPNAYEECELWGAGKADPIEDQAVNSDIPTLVLSGEYDPVTPPSWGELAAQTLPNSYFYVVRGGGHAVSAFDECLVHVVNQFLDDPMTEPDATCVQDIGTPAWSLPDDPFDIYGEE